MPKKSRRKKNCLTMVQKRWKKHENDSEVKANTNCETENITPRNLRQQKLETSLETVHEVNSDEFKYIIVDISTLSNLVKDKKCDDCGGKCLTIDSGSEQHGFSHELQLKCSFCEDSVKSSTFTSKRSETGSSRPSFDVNQRITQAFVKIGKGYAGLQQFCMIMNMDVMCNTSFNKHVTTMHEATNSAVSDIVDNARCEVRNAYSDLVVNKSEVSLPAVLDIAVSYDGTWLTRGHTSMFGVGCVIDLLTGFVIDCEVMSKYCQKCHIAKKRKSAKEFTVWFAVHAAECDINHTGSSGSMEVNAAVALWKRSEQYGFRYTTLLSDGDAKTFSKLCEVKPYGDGVCITKEECVNHVGKRLGTALRNVVKECRTVGKSLGGRGHGTLKATTISKLTRYYQKAILDNQGDLHSMKTAIYATLYHSISTDEKPQHMKCPSGRDSWCFYQRASAEGVRPASHRDKVGTPLQEAYLRQVLPVYQRLASDSLLQRCLQCRTQNANESLHSAIWRHFPKDSFGSKRRLKIAVALAVSEYNAGTITTVIKTQEAAGISPGQTSVQLGMRRDRSRVLKIKQRATQKFQQYRRTVKFARIVSQEAAKRKEGTTYKAGHF